jgi:hypothetical protein
VLERGMEMRAIDGNVWRADKAGRGGNGRKRLAFARGRGSLQLDSMLCPIIECQLRDMECIPALPSGPRFA